MAEKIGRTDSDRLLAIRDDMKLAAVMVGIVTASEGGLWLDPHSRAWLYQQFKKELGDITYGDYVANKSQKTKESG